nr:amidohydrolase family protein [Edaphobacter lichenicola]
MTAAHAHGLKLTGHLCSVGFREAIAMGIDNLEHGLITGTDLVSTGERGVCPSRHEVGVAIAAVDMQGPQIQSLIHELIQHDVAITSTLAVVVDAADDQPSLESLNSTKAAMSPCAWNDYLAIRKRMEKSPDKQLSKIQIHKEMEFEREFFRQGGLLMAGADTTGIGDTIAGIADQHEMELLIEAGFSASEAVRIFSLDGARYLGRDKEIGTIEKGKRADLLLLDGDFEHDPHAIEKPETVFKNGVAWDSAKLFASVAGLAGEE